MSSRGCHRGSVSLSLKTFRWKATLQTWSVEFKKEQAGMQWWSNEAPPQIRWGGPVSGTTCLDTWASAASVWNILYQMCPRAGKCVGKQHSYLHSFRLCCDAQNISQYFEISSKVHHKCQHWATESNIKYCCPHFSISIFPQYCRDDIATHKILTQWDSFLNIHQKCGYNDRSG